MGNNSPSRYRREGEEAFHPDTLMSEFCPYSAVGLNSFKWDAYAEGWERGAANWLSDLKEAEEDDAEFLALSCCCPWNIGDDCSANRDWCAKENCAPWHFKNA